MEKAESTFFFISVFLKRNNINVDSKSMLITKRVEKDTASDAKTSKTYLFFRVFAICLVLMLRYKNLILKNKKNIILKYFKIKKKL